MGCLTSIEKRCVKIYPQKPSLCETEIFVHKKVGEKCQYYSNFIELAYFPCTILQDTNLHHLTIQLYQS